MIYFIIGFIVNTVIWLVVRLKYKDEKYCWQTGLALGLVFALFGFVITPFFLTERVEYSKEIVSVKGQYFDETRDAANNECVWVYTKDGDSINKKMLYGGINEIKYKGGTARVEYAEYEPKDLSILEEALLFPTNLSAYLARSAEGVTIVIPESEKQ